MRMAVAVGKFGHDASVELSDNTHSTSLKPFEVCMADARQKAEYRSFSSRLSYGAELAGVVELAGVNGCEAVPSIMSHWDEFFVVDCGRCGVCAGDVRIASGGDGDRRGH